MALFYFTNNSTGWNKNSVNREIKWVYLFKYLSHEGSVNIRGHSTENIKDMDYWAKCVSLKLQGKKVIRGKKPIAREKLKPEDEES